MTQCPENANFENPFSKGPNIEYEPKCKYLTKSNGGDYPGQPKMGIFLTLRVYGSPLYKIYFWKSFFFMLQSVQVYALSQIVKSHYLKHRKCSPENRKRANVNTIYGYMAAPLNMHILKIRFFHVTKGPNIGIEPNFRDPTTSNVKDYPGKLKMG